MHSRPIAIDFVLSFCISDFRGRRRALQEVIAAIGAVDAGPTMEERCHTQKDAYARGQAFYDESIGPHWTKLMDDAVKEELEFVRTQHVHHEVRESYFDRIWT